MPLLLARGRSGEPEPPPDPAAEYAGLVAELRRRYPDRDSVQEAAAKVTEPLLAHAELHPDDPTAAGARLLAAEVYLIGGNPAAAQVQWRLVAERGARPEDRARALYLLGDDALLRSRADRRRAEARLDEAEVHFRALAKNHPGTRWAAAAARVLRYFDLRSGGAVPDVVLRCEKDGEPLPGVSSSRWRGKLILVDFWTSDSPGQGDFEATLAHDLSQVLREYPRLRGRVEVVGVNLDRDRERFEKAVRDWAIPWPQIHDGLGFEGPVARAFALPHLPHLTVIDPEGSIAYLGPDRQEFFRRASTLLKSLGSRQ